MEDFVIGEQFQNTLWDTENHTDIKTPEEYAQFFQDILRKNENYQEVVLTVSGKNFEKSINISLPYTVYRENFSDSLFARLKTEKEVKYISFKEKYRNRFENHGILTYGIKSEPDFFRIPLDEFSKIEELKNDPDFIQLIEDIFLDALTFEPFGCCHKYVECSDAKKCLHDDLIYATACMYRKNLEQGRIFYGKNKNIDNTSKASKSDIFNGRQYVVVDVETADLQNSYICSIALVLIKNGKIADTYYSLINADCEFVERNVRIHGITKDMVYNSPTFKEFWNKYGKVFSDYIFVAHHSNFDLSVINKELLRNDIDTNFDSIAYIDTFQLSQQYLDLENYRLPNVCQALNIEFKNHHNALADCTAAANILMKLSEMYSIKFQDCCNIFERDKTKNLNTTPTKSNKPKDSIFNDCPENIELSEKKICLTGHFSKISKNELKVVLESNGAVTQKSVTSKTDYVIVGEDGSTQWKGDGFGSKIEKALNLNQNGSSILILRENEFLEQSHLLDKKQKKQNVNPDNFYLAPDESWKQFNSTEELITFLKKHKLLAPTLNEMKNYYYNGISSDGYILCDICGYVDDTIMVIKINNNLHCIDVDCFRDMQPTKTQKEEYDLV